MKTPDEMVFTLTRWSRSVIREPSLLLDKRKSDEIGDGTPESLPSSPKRSRAKDADSYTVNIPASGSEIGEGSTQSPEEPKPAEIPKIVDQAMGDHVNIPASGSEIGEGSTQSQSPEQPKPAEIPKIVDQSMGDQACVTYVGRFAGLRGRELVESFREFLNLLPPNVMKTSSGCRAPDLNPRLRDPTEGLEKSLLAVQYKRGILKLLDQRKLPLETIYLDIKNATDGCRAIKNMVVRGAPAVAIAAVLSLAIEVLILKDLKGKTGVDAVSFLERKLDDLVLSCPTAVNLSHAAQKLKQVLKETAPRAGIPMLVFKEYIGAAEIMLVDDVASNKAIGLHGSTFLLDKLKESKKISVLTHSNTGSLATAGYGTALGVIRALHVKGVLERAYCTETRPTNEGSRLTAFELVYEKIPATLIADSAAAELMKAGRVNAVIVGADRVAANGDTANTIGTYTLALCAKHHSIPFFVAAPLCSIDLSTLSREEIVIEERSPEELLNSRGGLGEQVAASGIAVWDPTCDVTPASMITGIITEEGVITKRAETFDIEDFKLLKQRKETRR